VSVTHLFAGIPTADFAVAVAWYERFFGAPADRFPHETEAVWQVVENALVYVVLNEELAGSGLLTLIVDDIATWARETRRRGIALPGIDKGVSVRRVTIHDPDGNSIQIAQVD
jgi:catechol 2,3-dioxygenase-like lactoylglutathione lyase family enzyme